MTNSLRRDFLISRKTQETIIRNFKQEMGRGLAGKHSSLKMLPTYLDNATGKETGRFLALDFGGTNFRAALVELGGKRNFKILNRVEVPLNKYMRAQGEALFEMMANCTRDLLKNGDTSRNWDVSPFLGFTFSFPVEQDGIASGRLLKWTKGFDISGVEGKDVMSLLGEALRKRGLRNVHPAALLNDTTATEIAGSYQDSHCDVGMILGTGTNICYREKTKNGVGSIFQLKTWTHPNGMCPVFPKIEPTPFFPMLINIESGNFDKLTQTEFDKELDRRSENPGEQILEKQISGRYLGELVRLILKRGQATFYNYKEEVKSSLSPFSTAHMSMIAADNSRGLVCVAKVLMELGVAATTLEDRKLLKEVCEIVSARAARLVACVLSAVVTKMDPALSQRHTIAVDGSVYEKYPGFAQKINEGFKGILGRTKAGRIKMRLVKDGSSIGAAIAAAGKMGSILFYLFYYIVQTWSTLPCMWEQKWDRFYFSLRKECRENRDGPIFVELTPFFNTECAVHSLAPKTKVQRAQGEWVYNLRAEWGYTGSEFCKYILGVGDAQRKITRWENGEETIPPDILNRLIYLKLQGGIAIDFQRGTPYVYIYKELQYQVAARAIERTPDKAKLAQTLSCEPDDLDSVLKGLFLRRKGYNLSHLYKGINIRLPERPLTFKQLEIEGKVAIYIKALEMAQGDVAKAAEWIGVGKESFSEELRRVRFKNALEVRALSANASPWLANLVRAGIRGKGSAVRPPAESRKGAGQRKGQSPKNGETKKSPFIMRVSERGPEVGLRVRLEGNEALGEGEIIGEVEGGVEFSPGDRVQAIEIKFERHFSPITLTKKAWDKLIIVEPSAQGRKHDREIQGAMLAPSTEMKKAKDAYLLRETMELSGWDL